MATSNMSDQDINRIVENLLNRLGADRSNSRNRGYSSTLNNAATNAANDAKVRQSLDSLREELQREKLKLDEKEKMYQRMLERIDASNAAVAEKERRRQLVAAKQAKLLEDQQLQAANEAILAIRARRVEAQKLVRDGIVAHRNELALIRESKLEELDLLNAKARMVELTDEEKTKWAELNTEITSLKERERKINEAITNNKKDNVSLELKLAQIQENALKREKEKLRIEQEYAEACEEAAKLREAEEITAEDERKITEDAAARRGQLLANLDADYGKENSIGNMLGGAINLGGGLQAMGLGGIESVVKTISSIKNVITNGNPLAIIIKLLTGVAKLVGKMYKAMSEGIEIYEDLLKSYLAKINTRLDNGTGSNYFAAITGNFVKALGSSGYFSQKGLIEKLALLSEQGIAYNLEQRTILAELSDRMVSTFDMLDSHLVQLTKLQQADMSVAQLGAESELTLFLNNMFEDTSYLTAEYDTVMTTITDALSLMDAEKATEWAFNVNKWLGSLYALGMSSGGISTIAEGINALATGNLDYFMGNSSATTLFASATGTSIADLLVKGLNTSNINDLMYNIVSYLSAINDDTNNVTKKIKAGLYGDFSVSDLRAVGNLATSVEDIAEIYEKNITWTQSIEKVNGYLTDFALTNTTFAIWLSNASENIKYALGEAFVNLLGSDNNGFIDGILDKIAKGLTGTSNMTPYLAYKIGDTVGGIGGSIILGISELSALGSTISTFFNLLDSFNSSLSGILGALNTDGLGIWDIGEDSLISARGQAYSINHLKVQGIETGLSASLSAVLNTINTDTVADAVSSSLAETAASYATASAIGSYEGTATVASLSELAASTSLGAAVVSATNTTSRDIAELYAELFEVQEHPIRVSLAKVEDEAQSNLINKTYNVADSASHSKLDTLMFRAVL